MTLLAKVMRTHTEMAASTQVNLVDTLFYGALVITFKNHFGREAAGGPGGYRRQNAVAPL